MKIYLLWFLFLVLSSYGHIALKLASQSRASELGVNYIFHSLVSIWGISGFLSWIASYLIWLLILKETSLFQANSIGMGRYIIISLAAIILLKENFTVHSLFGMVLIAAGIFLVKS